jgi:hypothetical protein
MGIEENTLEKTGDHCEVCGVKLTPQELQMVLENGGPALCTIHATEAEPALEADELEFDE